MRGLLAAMPVVVCAALVTACGGGASPAAPAPAAASPAPASHARATPSRHPSPTPQHAAAPAAEAARAAELAPADLDGDVDCGSITAANGRQVKVVAKASSEGVAGCTEAIDVLSAYFERAATESEGTAHELNVQGWQCSTIDAASVPGGIIGCEKQGLTIRAVS